MKNKNRIAYQLGETLQVFRLGETTNKKICSNPKTKIVQHYSFSFDQFNYVKNCVNSSQKIDPKTFFDFADKVCFDCPFRGYLKCYTHKYMQFSGFVSMLKSIIKENNIRQQSEETINDVVNMSKDRYVRFGTYGEPSLLPIELIDQIVSVGLTYTGYTHQWRKKPQHAKYFMASTHNLVETLQASRLGYRSFMAVKELQPKDSNLVNCPASKEMGFKSDCIKCGLCSGTNGKGSKSIQILNH
jgi:hypothetical protein